jgi:SAM-dependent MidA family methyltransferase
MSRPILPEPPQELKHLSQALSEKIHLEIEAQGFVPFSRFMEMALYEPGLGYYSAGLHKFGKSGDFITAPELGSLFAQCLAEQVREIAAHLGPYDILELGAGTGKLAADLLRVLPRASQPRRYLILERSADLQAVQQHTIAAQLPDWQDRVKWLTQPPGEPWDGVLLANEVIDALAVERFLLRSNGVEQVGVGRSADGGFAWRSRPAPPELSQAVMRLGLQCQGPYTSELHLHLGDWLESVTGQLRTGLALLIDYGYPRSEYYLPERNQGTLMCHYRHLAHDDVFFWPGLQDITAFVDFTALAEAADACGLEVAGYTSQAMFLLACGLDRILSQRLPESADAGARINAEARRLTMPASMGERFQVMALARGMDLMPSGFSLRDLRYRL